MSDLSDICHTLSYEHAISISDLLDICQIHMTSCVHLLQHTATHCNTLQHTATHCNTLQHTATHCNVLQHTATYCNTLQRTATHCSNVLQHTMTSYVQLLQWQQQQNVRQRWRERISTNLRPLLEEVHFTFLSPVGRQMWLLLRFRFNVSFRIRRSLL